MAKIQICKESDIKEGTITAFHTKYGPVAIARSGDRLFAFEEHCTHSNVSMTSGHTEGEVAVCKAHGARFDLNSGSPVNLPATSPLEMYSVTVTEDGTVEVEID